MHRWRHLILATCLALLGACAIRPVEPFQRPAPDFALPAGDDSAFTDIETNLRAAHGPEVSGFALLDTNEEGLRWRLAIIDSAKHTIDVQYYLWYGDASGRLLLKRVLDAADRGVKVRMLVDDLNTLIADAGTVGVRDELAATIDAHPNVQLRLFNPWKDRTLAGRIGESVTELQRVNHRMHNKCIVVDNRVTILGGRNIGDEYLGLNPHFNFHDIDVIGVGLVARQASAEFDLYWNSDWVMPASALELAPPQTGREAVHPWLAQSLAETPALARFPAGPQSWSTALSALSGRLHVGTSRVVADVPAAGVIRQEMVEGMYELAESATREILVINAYIIPSERTMDKLRNLLDRGVSVKVVTNSLASHDVPAVNSHYKRWRKAILQAGAELYEMRHDAAIQPLVSDTPPMRAKFMGLHSKAMVIDRKRVYIGSMNFDPRSAAINTEEGLIIESPGLAQALAEVIERATRPENSWHVQVDGRGELRWTNDRETVTTQPARNWWQRVEDVFFMAFPREFY